MKMVTIDTIRSAQASDRENAIGPSRTQRIKPRVSPLLARFSRWWMIRSTRAHLAELDDAMLRDVGVTREAAAAELKRSIYLFYRTPF